MFDFDGKASSSRVNLSGTGHGRHRSRGAVENSRSDFVKRQHQEREAREKRRIRNASATKIQAVFRRRHSAKIARAVQRQIFDKRHADIAKVRTVLPVDKQAKFVFLALIPLLRLFAFFFTWDEDEKRLTALLDLVLFSSGQVQSCNVICLALADAAQRQTFQVLIAKLVLAVLQAERARDAARLLLALQAALFTGPPDYKPVDAQLSAATVAQLFRRVPVLAAVTRSVLPEAFRRESDAALSAQQATELIILCCVGLEAYGDSERHEALTCLLSTPWLAEFLCRPEGRTPSACIERVAALVTAAASARFGVPQGRVGAPARLLCEEVAGMPRQAWLLANLVLLLEKFALAGRGNQADLPLWLAWVCRAKERCPAVGTADEYFARQLDRVQSAAFVRALLQGVDARSPDAMLAVCQLYFSPMDQAGLGKPPAEVLQTLAFATPFSERLFPMLARLMGSDSMEAAFKELGPPGLASPHAMRLHAFCTVYAMQLGPMYDSEFFSSANPLSLRWVQVLASFLNRLCFHFVTSHPDQNSLTPMGKALRMSLTSLVSLLYNRHQRRPILQTEDGWIISKSRLLLRDAPVVDLGMGTQEEVSEDSPVEGRDAGAGSSEVGEEEGGEADSSEAMSRERVGGSSGEGQASSSSKEKEGVLEAVLAEIPHVLPFKDRVVLLHTAILTDQEARLATRGPWTHAALVPHRIRRNFLVEDAFDAFESLADQESLRDVFRVEFVAPDGSPESGVDGGGLFKEFMIHICRTMFDPDFGLFTATSEQTLYPSPNAFAVHGRRAADLFTLLGKVVGKAIYELFLLEPQLSRTFLNRLLGRTNEVDDIAALDKELHRNLLRVKETEHVEDLALTFSVSSVEPDGRCVEHDLIPDGRNTKVTQDNLTRYIHLVANYKTNTQLEKQTAAFLKGLLCAIPMAWLKMFDPYELNTLVSGSTTGFDVQDLRRNTVYAGGYQEDSPVVIWLWKLLDQHLEPDDKGRFLMFATSCSRAPLLGFAHLHPKFCVHRVPDSMRLPTASTCANLLKLPDYVRFEDLKDKLTQAIRAEAGFDLS